MKDFNATLSNSTRTDSIGFNVWTFDIDPSLIDYENRPDFWNGPKPGFHGRLFVCHETNLKDPLTYQFRVNPLPNLSGKPVTLQVSSKRSDHYWTPAFQKTKYHADVFEIIEAKFITQDDVMVSELTIVNRGMAPRSLSITVGTGNLGLALDRERGLLAGEIKSKTQTGCLMTQLDIEVYGVVMSNGFGLIQNRYAVSMMLAPGETRKVRTVLGIHKERDGAFELAEYYVGAEDVLRQVVDSFNSWFEKNVPVFTCSDQQLELISLYRWFLLKRSIHRPSDLIHDHPYRGLCMYESPIGSWFSGIVGLPIPMQILEASWLKDDAPVLGQIDNWVQGVANTRGYIQWTPWAIWLYSLIRGNRRIFADVVTAMEDYTLREDGKRDEAYIIGGDKNLPVLRGSWVTGAEYQPNFYCFTPQQWDHTYSEEFTWLSSIYSDRYIPEMIRPDAAAMYLLNLKAVINASRVLGNSDLLELAQGRFDAAMRELLDKLWHQDTQFFYAVEPETLQRALDAKCYDGFVPFLFGLVEDENYQQAFEHLLDPAEFWSEFPIPSASMDCEAYSPCNEWIVGPYASQDNPHYYVCAWNGPTWNYANSLILEALGASILMYYSPDYLKKWKKLLTQWTKAQFFPGEETYPISMEHFHPETGRPYRPMPDYFHCSYNDLIIRYVVGIKPREDDTLELAPFGDDFDHWEIRNLDYRGHDLSVSWRRQAEKADQGLRVYVDGKQVHQQPDCTKVLLPNVLEQ